MVISPQVYHRERLAIVATIPLEVMLTDIPSSMRCISQVVTVEPDNCDSKKWMDGKSETIEHR
jgi:hypothetical protein